MQDVADKKKQMTDEDLLALITDEVNQPVTLWSLLDLQVISTCLPLHQSCAKMQYAAARQSLRSLVSLLQSS